MNKYYIPTIEEIYNIYHRETMHAMKGIYPKSIKNFENILNKKNIELLIRFQNVIKRSYDSIDWKLYIKACAEYFKYRFDINNEILNFGSYDIDLKKIIGSTNQYKPEEVDKDGESDGTTGENGGNAGTSGQNGGNITSPEQYAKELATKLDEKCIVNGMSLTDFVRASIVNAGK